MIFICVKVGVKDFWVSVGTSMQTYMFRVRQRRNT